MVRSPEEVRAQRDAVRTRWTGLRADHGDLEALMVADQALSWVLGEPALYFKGAPIEPLAWNLTPEVAP
ncbi:MAG: hypothetical protein NVSMB32_09180 [Actinomycetota bacterium]